MHSQLSRLLGLSEEVVDGLVNELEKLSGYHSEDVRLLTDIRQLVNQKLIDLSLDPADTTGEELFYALQARAQADIQAFNKSAGLHKLKTAASLNRRLAEIYRKNWEAPEAWSLKPSAAKKMLRANPPKKFMKALNYRSVESLLKREDPKIILAVAPLVESRRWHDAIKKSSEALPPSDFGVSKLQIMALPTKIAHKLGLEAGTWSSFLMSTVVFRIDEHQPLLSALELENAVRGVRAASALLKMDHFNGPNHQTSLDVAGVNFSWWSVLEYYDRSSPSDSESNLPLEILSQPANLLKRLSAITPSLAWWADTAWLGVSQDKRPVSLNLIDVLTAVRGQIPYKKRSAGALGDELLGQLLSRYLDHPGVSSELIDTFSASESISEADFASPDEEFGGLGQKVEWA